MYRSHIDATSDDCFSHMFEWAVGNVDYAQRKSKQFINERVTLQLQYASDIGNTLCDKLSESGLNADFTVNESHRSLEIKLDDPTSSISRKRLIEVIKSTVKSATSLGCSIAKADIIENVGARIIVNFNPCRNKYYSLNESSRRTKSVVKAIVNHIKQSAKNIALNYISELQDLIENDELTSINDLAELFVENEFEEDPGLAVGIVFDEKGIEDDERDFVFELLDQQRSQIVSDVANIFRGVEDRLNFSDKNTKSTNSNTETKYFTFISDECEINTPIKYQSGFADIDGRKRTEIGGGKKTKFNSIIDWMNLIGVSQKDQADVFTAIEEKEKYELTNKDPNDEVKITKIILDNQYGNLSITTIDIWIGPR